uniref:Protein phosphatase Slingshot homolog 1 n=1 Tax=Oncorhynchus kisutch TaxID=8019 RepID=A0A8C7DCD0_ONCKI
MGSKVRLWLISFATTDILLICRPTSTTKRGRENEKSFFMVKGAALFLQQGTNAQGPKTPTHHKLAGDLPQHLQVMINTLRSEDRIKLAVRLESGWSDRVRYMVVVYTSGRQDTEENILLGMDFTDKDSKSCSIGMVLPLWSDTKIHLDGDGGFSVNTGGRSHVFKPVSVQAMWSALQILHKACEVSRRYNYFPGGMALTWMGFYESCITSEQSCINEWNAMTDLETTRPDSPAMFVDRPTESERTECAIKAKLRTIMMFRDLENVTSKEIRVELEQHMSCNLKEYKEFIDNEMLLILGQMDKATLIFDHLYLGSEWNASNLEELRDCGVGHILNVTREIDNFFPGMFTYHNIRVYDEEATDLLAHWNETYNFIVRAKKNQSKCLVHCKMGVSRSASTVIAYAMKEYGWTLEKAYNFVKQKRSIARPNAGFMRQLAEYEGILDASKQRHNKLWRPEGGEDIPDEASGQCCGGEETPVEGEAWGREGCGASPCRGLGLEVEPLDPLNYNYYFRRLSDTALDSEVFIEIEDVERDALLEDEGFPMAQLALPGEGTAAQTCGGRLEPLEDMRLRLEFSTVEEEDEEEAQKEEAEMAALAWTAAGGEGAREDEERKEQVNMNRFNNENANNSNRLAAKRSCPATFDVSGAVNSYLYLYKWGCKSWVNFDLNLFGVKVKILSLHEDPPGTHFTNTPAPHSPCTLPATIARLEAYRQRLVSPMSCEELPRDRHCSLETEDMDELQEDEEEEEQEPRPGREVGTGAITELTFMKLSLDGERPAGQSPSGGVELQPPGGGVELQRTGPELGMGLVRQRAEQLERLSGLAMEGLLSGAGLAEQMDLHLAVEEMEGDVGMHSETPIPSTSCMVTAADPQMNTTPVSYPQGSAQTWTPVSSPHGSTLTRSSSSDSLHSNRGGHQGLVRQRTQEIETRMRLAGLTFPSLLKRSSSLAKLGGLTFSTEDLSHLADDQAQLFSTEPPACPSTPGGEEPSEPPCTPRS